MKLLANASEDETALEAVPLDQVITETTDDLGTEALLEASVEVDSEAGVEL